MGVQLSTYQLNSTTTYPPKSRLVPFPSTLTAAPGELVTYFMAKPPSYDLPSDTPAGPLFWWTDIDFVPFQDHQLFVSVGAYIKRPSGSALKASHLLQGLIYKWIFNEENHKIELFRGSRTSALPNITVHPSGECILYVGLSTIHFMNFSTMKTESRGKATRNNNFQHCCMSPNGFHIAYMARTSHKIELGLVLIEPSGYLSVGIFINCDAFCKNFVSDRTYTDRYHCKFSPDSSYIAAATSYGHLIIVNRNDLTLHCSISPGLVEWGGDSMTNERSFDFDPRYHHQRVAFGSVGKSVHFCDIDNNEIDFSIKLKDFEDEGHVQCLKYAQRGHCLAVASSTGMVHILEPDEGNCLIRLDGNTLPREAALENVNGDLAEAVSMSFTTTGDILAVSHTDGYVRLWKLPAVIKLQELCKMVLYQTVHVSHFNRLPLPEKLVKQMISTYV